MSDSLPSEFRFIDLFAGIGGIRIAYEAHGGRCVMTSELDKFARQTYETYFDDPDDADHLFNDDITKVPPVEVPDHEILLAGFPCQSFSIAGVSKKNALGREHGFKDPTSGTLFFNIKEILLEKQPNAFLLENVKNLMSHDKGRTWKVIAYCLDKAGYAFTHRVLDAAEVVPQHRERVFIAGFRREHFELGQSNYDWTPFWEEVEQQMANRRDEHRQRHGVDKGSKWPLVDAILEAHDDVPEKYTLTPRLWEYLQEYKAKHRAKGNGFGYGMVKGPEEYTRTLSARYYKDGSEVLVYQGENKRPRRLTPRECARLQGFPEDFEAMFDRENEQPVSDTQAYRQFGNSVCVPVVESIADVHLEYLQNPDRLHELPESTTPKQGTLDGIPEEIEVLMQNAV